MYLFSFLDLIYNSPLVFGHFTHFSFHKSCSRNLRYIGLHIIKYFLDNKKIAVVAKKRCRQLHQMSSKSGFLTIEKLYITCRFWWLFDAR